MNSATVRVFRSSVGRIAVAATSRGLRHLRLMRKGAGRVASPRALPGAKAEAHAERAERQICEYLAGRRQKFSLPLDLEAIPPFQKKVLRLALRIPYGRTVTYGQLAARAGRPRAARAVGRAMARNPLPLVIPCHRVVATGGGLGGYSGGLNLKRRLLALEGRRLHRAAQ